VLGWGLGRRRRVGRRGSSSSRSDNYIGLDFWLRKTAVVYPSNGTMRLAFICERADRLRGPVLQSTESARCLFNVSTSAIPFCTAVCRPSYLTQDTQASADLVPRPPSAKTRTSINHLPQTTPLRPRPDPYARSSPHCPASIYDPSRQNLSNSAQALSRSSLTTTASCTPGVFANSSSFRACASRCAIASSESVPRPRSRFSRICMSGGCTKR